MLNFIDRRLNPRDKSIGNRQRFLRRAKRQIKEAVDKAANERDITDVAKGGKISIPSNGITEPTFRQNPAIGDRERVFPGNREFVPGDQIKKPPKGAGEGGGKKGSDDGEGADDFVFSLSRSEFLDLLFEDLELPDLVKSSLKDTQATKPRRAGYSNAGTTPNVNMMRTMRNSIGRRLILRGPVEERIRLTEIEISDLKSREDTDVVQRQRLAELATELDNLKRRRRAVPYIDPVDIRYNRFEAQPQPRTKAVMFCLMDVSGSMGEHEKDLAKRFFVLLHLFLQRKYDRVEIVFIRHTHLAQEVDEETFFYGQESGGTVVSTALIEMRRIIEDRFPTNDWNIYAAQASDGDNFGSDTEKCVDFLANEVLPLCQYYAYVEILSDQELERLRETGGKELWRGYEGIDQNWSKFSMKHVSQRSDIYPVFRELFSRQENGA